MIDTWCYYGLYSLLAVILIAFAFFKTKIDAYNKYSLLFVIIIVSFAIAVIAAIRPFESADTVNYYKVYSSTMSPFVYIPDCILLGERVSGIETSFVFLIALLKSVSFGFRAVLFFIAFINSFLILYASIKIMLLISDNYDAAKLFALFVSYFGMHYCCIAIRGGLSVGIGLLAIYFFLSKKELLSILFIYLSVLIHMMSALFILIIAALFIYNYQKKTVEVGINRHLIIVYIICLVSLLLNLGSRFVGIFVYCFGLLCSKLGILSFSGYMVGLDMAGGIKDWFIVIAIGVALMAIQKKTKMNCAISWIVMAGLLITSFLYPIRAINRAADYCYLLLLPLICNLNHEKQLPKDAVIAELIVYPMLLAVQFSL